MLPLTLLGLAVLGLFGEYPARIYMEIKQAYATFGITFKFFFS